MQDFLKYIWSLSNVMHEIVKALQKDENPTFLLVEIRT